MNVKLFSSSLALFDIRREYTPSRPPNKNSALEVWDVLPVHDRGIFLNIFSRVIILMLVKLARYLNGQNMGRELDTEYFKGPIFSR